MRILPRCKTISSKSKGQGTSQAKERAEVTVVQESIKKQKELVQRDGSIKSPVFKAGVTSCGPTP